MNVASRAKKAVKRFIFGPPDFPQQVTVGMREPQQEVIVRLEGPGVSRDVTHCHMMACAAPFTVGIGSNIEWNPREDGDAHFSLRFYEHEHSQSLLGEIRMRFSSGLRAGPRQLHLFQTTGSRNRCLPTGRIWVRYLEYAYYRWRAPKSEVPMTARDVHSMCVFYTCPRPVALVSVAHADATNIFPMNLMGPIGDGYFAFALNTGKPVTALLERASRLALSAVPLEQAPLAYALAKNHKWGSIDLAELPFVTRPSSTFGFPVPQFALGIRELQIEEIRKLGSHMLFLARTLHDEPCGDGLQFFTLHGIYQARRQSIHRS